MSLLVSVAWLITLTLGVFAFLRVFYHDATFALTWINAFTRYIYLPAYACLVFALWKRRRWLAIASAGIIGFHVWCLAPDFLPGRRNVAANTTDDAGTGAKRTLRVFFANVRSGNKEFGTLWDEIASADPDIVFLVEFSPEWREALRQSQLLTRYPYDSDVNWGAVQNFVFSKVPLKAITHDWVVHRCIEAVDVRIGDESLRIVALHAPRPMLRDDNDYKGFWNRVVPLLLGERRPLVVVGDFNATQFSRVYEQLKDGGLRSAHEDRGRGYATTWPNGTLPLPPIRIDQAFLSPEVTCRCIAEGRGVGSDHKPLILDIEIRSP